MLQRRRMLTFVNEFMRRANDLRRLTRCPAPSVLRFSPPSAVAPRCGCNRSAPRNEAVPPAGRCYRRGRTAGPCPANDRTRRPRRGWHCAASRLRRGAGIGGAEALGKRQVGLEDAEDGTDVDRGRRAHQLQPTVAAPGRVDKAVLAERADHLSEMVFRCVAGGCDVALANGDMWIDRAVHQRSGGEIGPHADAHRIIPKGVRKQAF